MTTYPRTNESTSGLDRPSPSFYSFPVNLPSLASLVDYVKRLVFNGVSTQPAPRIASPELQSRDAESWTMDDRRDANSAEQPRSDLESTPPNHNNHSNLESGGSQETDQPVQVQEHEPNDAHPRYRKLSWMGWSAFIIGLLFAITVPGLIVGIVTKQFAWGIGTSGVVTPVGVWVASSWLKRRR